MSDVDDMIEDDYDPNELVSWNLQFKFTLLLKEKFLKQFFKFFKEAILSIAYLKNIENVKNKSIVRVRT